MLRRSLCALARFASTASSTTTTAATSAQTAEVVDSSLAHKDVTSRIGGELSDSRNRLFAVVYINERQFKVGQNDLISLEGSLPLKVGDEIVLEKVLAVGGRSFSVFGRPLLSPSAVSVTATVVEKTTKSPELQYVHLNHQQVHGVNWLSKEVTVLRINEVTAKPELLGEQ